MLAANVRRQLAVKEWLFVFVCSARSICGEWQLLRPTAMGLIEFCGPWRFSKTVLCIYSSLIVAHIYYVCSSPHVSFRTAFWNVRQGAKIGGQQNLWPLKPGYKACPVIASLYGKLHCIRAVVEVWLATIGYARLAFRAYSILLLFPTSRR